MFAGGSGRERFPLTAKPPAHQGFPSRAGPPPPQRHALHNLSGEGPRAQAAAGPDSLSSRFSRPQDAAARGEQRGTEGRPAGRADGGGALTVGLGGGAGREWAEPHPLARRRQGWRLLAGRTADPSPPAAGCFHRNPAGRRGRGGSSGGGGTFPHPGQRQRGAPPTARSGQLGSARSGRAGGGARTAERAAQAREWGGERARARRERARRRWRGGAGRLGSEAGGGAARAPSPPTAAAQPDQTGCQTTVHRSPPWKLPTKAPAFSRH